MITSKDFRFDDEMLAVGPYKEDLDLAEKLIDAWGEPLRLIGTIDPREALILATTLGIQVALENVNNPPTEANVKALPLPKEEPPAKAKRKVKEFAA